MSETTKPKSREDWLDDAMGFLQAASQMNLDHKHTLIAIRTAISLMKQAGVTWEEAPEFAGAVPPDPRDALIARLRSELAACHKVIIDAMAELDDGSPIGEISGDETEKLHMVDQIAKALQILDSAPEPGDETLAIIEAQDGGDDVQAR